MSSVLVTGANGFAGSHVVKQLLEKKYTVIGSVRSEQKAQQVKDWFNDSNFHPVIVDVENGAFFDDVFEKYPEITTVFSVAAPFDLTVTDFKKDVLDGGDKLSSNLYEALDKYGKNVKAVVNVSSIAAHTTFEESSDPHGVINDENWSAYTLEQAKEGVFPAYHYSKTQTEKRFWEFIKSHPDITGNSVSPTFIFGPQVVDSLAARPQLSFSADVIRNFLFAGPEGQDKIIPLQGWVVDVRDVAKVLITVSERPEIKNERLLLAPNKFTVQELINIARKAVPAIRPHVVPEGEVKFSVAAVDDSKTRKLLSLDFISLDKIVQDTVKQIVDQHPNKFK